MILINVKIGKDIFFINTYGFHYRILFYILPGIHQKIKQIKPNIENTFNAIDIEEHFNSSYGICMIQCISKSIHDMIDVIAIPNNMKCKFHR